MTIEAFRRSSESTVRWLPSSRGVDSLLRRQCKKGETMSEIERPFQVGDRAGWRKSQPDTDGTPHGWIQWKGTDVCLDFYCKCGAHGHLDAEFAYHVKCGRCGQVYEMSGHVEARPVDTDPHGNAIAGPIVYTPHPGEGR